MESFARPYIKAGIAATMASAIVFSPLAVTSPHQLTAPAVPHVTVSEMRLGAVISPADVAALVANLDNALKAVGDTVTSVVDTAGNTLTSALHSAATLSDTVWDQLIAAAAGSPPLKAVLVALKSASSGGLGQLATTVSTAGAAITLSTGQVTEILTSAVTGSLGTALQAVANVVNNPLAASSYIGLLASPLGIAGLVLQHGVTGVTGLASNGLKLADTLVHGVTAQITNALSTVNGLLDAGKELTDIALINGALTAVQGIVSAPVTAVLAGVNGISSAISNAGSATLDRLAGGANAVIGTWLGNGSEPGAVEKALSSIGSAPLSPASYTHAVSVLVGAVGTTVKSVVGTASSFASLPFRVGADLTDTAADVVNSLANGLATAATGVLQAAGVSPLIAGLPHTLAAAVTTAVKVAAFAAKTTLNTIASAIDFGQAIGGAVTSLAVPTAKLSATAAADDAVTTPNSRSPHTLTLTTADVSPVTAEEGSTTGGHAAPEPEAQGEHTNSPAAQTETAHDSIPAGSEAATPATNTATAEPAPVATDTPEPDTTRKPTTPRDIPTATEPAAQQASSNATPAAAEPATTKPTTKRDTDTAKTADTYGRHAAPADRDATASTSTSTPTAASAGGGRHRRSDDSTNTAGKHDPAAHDGASSNTGKKAAA